MKDYVRIDIRSDLDQAGWRELLKAALPDFAWRGGDSDAQGPYLTGRRPDGVHIQCWMGEAPAAMAVSFRGAKLSQAAMSSLITTLEQRILPQAGEVLRVDAGERP
ncbi:MAG: hypothetical protein WAQ08_17285 [Aquabacterium sp.]|jgi:hypothetical protein|uniref:hypothetical protein n=1 Tax=Aquabacterium sp. TaxID=1872578 RepID=UPI003BAE4813